MEGVAALTHSDRIARSDVTQSGAGGEGPALPTEPPRHRWSRRLHLGAAFVNANVPPFFAGG